MTGFTVPCGLDPYFRRRCAAHLLQTHHMQYNGQVRQDAFFFGEAPEALLEARERSGELPPESVALRLLGEAFAGTGPVSVPLGRFDKGSRYRMSALLEQSWSRSLRETEPDAVTGQLEAVLTQWDRQERVRGSEDERAYERGRDTAIREQKLAAAEAQQRHAQAREAEERRSRLLAEQEA